jgi:hypothetical protein
MKLLITSEGLSLYIPSISLCVYVCPLIVARLRQEKSYRRNKYIRINGKIVRRVVFYAVRVESRESRRLVLPRTSCFRANRWTIRQTW